jgi:hypothetical protein
LVGKTIFSTQRLDDYDKFLDVKNDNAEFRRSKYFQLFEKYFMTAEFFHTFAGLGFNSINPREKEFNSLTQTVFYLSEFMQRQSWSGLSVVMSYQSYASVSAAANK